MKRGRPYLTFFFLVWGSVFLFYSVFAGRSATGYADSDELLTMSYLWSLPHPSGFPLLILITGFFMRLSASWLSPAISGNLTAALMQSLSVACLALSALIVLPTSLIKTLRYRWLLMAIFLSAFAFSLTGYFWLYGEVLEAASFTNAFLGLTLVFALRWWTTVAKTKPGLSLFYLTWFMAGIALSHIQTSILIFPGLSLLLILSFRQWFSIPVYRQLRTWFLATLATVMGYLLPNLLIFWYHFRQQPYSWSFEPTLAGWWHYLLRKDYQGYFPEESISRLAYFDSTLTHWLPSQLAWLNYLLDNLGFIGLGLIGLGLIYAFHFKKAMFYIILAWLVISGPLFIGYMGVPFASAQDLEYFMKLGVILRQFLIHHFLLGLPFILGAVAIFVFLSKRPRFFWATTLLYLGLFGYILFNFQKHLPLGNQRSNRLAEAYAHQMLQSAADDSVIICSSDLACFSLMYAQAVEGYKPSLTVLTKSDTYVRRFLENQPHFFGFTYHDNPYYFAYLIASNLLKRQVYLTNPTTYYIDYIGLDADPFYLVPRGYLFEVVKRVPENITDSGHYDFTSNVLVKPQPADHYLYGFRGYLASLHQTVGMLLSNYGQLESGKFHLNLAQTLDPAFQQPREWLAKFAQFTPPENYGPNRFVDDRALFSQYRQLLSEGQLDPAYESLRKLTYLNPLDKNLHLNLIDLYLLGGFKPGANLELDQLKILGLDPILQLDLESRIATAAAK